MNGCEDPYIEVSEVGFVLRLVNASNARRYELSANDGRSLYLIASDQRFVNVTGRIEIYSYGTG